MIPRFKKGALVWYLQRDGTYREAKVVSVDVTVDPPSYAVDLGESVRETESHRLQLRQAGKAPPSVPAQRPLASPAAVPQQAALELEDDDFGDFAVAAEAAQPNVSYANAFTASAHGFNASGSGFSQHQPHLNGFCHAPSALHGLNGHTPPMYGGGAACVPAATSQENGEEGFAAFAGAEELPPGPSVVGTQGGGQAFSAQFALTGQPWPEATKYTAAPAAVQLADQPAFHSLHASQQHARGPSAESSASLHSADRPASSVFDGHFPTGLLNGAKGEREYRVTPASTLSIAQEDLGSDSDDDFGDFEDARPDVAWNPSVKSELLDRNAPIPLSLFGEEEDDSAPSEPALDLAAPWGGFMLPGLPWASAVAEQQKAAASQPAVSHAAHEPNAAVVPLPQQAFASSAHESGGSVPSMAVPVQLPGMMPDSGPATSLAAESSDSWVTAFIETPKILPGSHGVQAGPAASEDSADEAQPPAAAALSDGRGSHTLQPLKAEPQEGFDSTSGLLQTTARDGPNDAAQLGPPGEPAADGADAAVTHPSSSAPAASGAASAQGPGGQRQIRPPPGSIDWSAMDFDFGSPGAPVNAAEPAPQHSILVPEQADRSSSAAVKTDAKPSDGSAEAAPSSSHAVPEQALEPPSVAQHADEEDDWDFGDFAEASASVSCPAAAGSAPAADLQYLQASSAAAGSQPMAEPLSAASEEVQLDWDKGALAHGILPAVPALRKGSGDGSNAAALSADSAEPHDGWGSWDASEAAAGSPAPVVAELGAVPSWAAELPTPKPSAELVPGGSGVMSFHQWDRAYSKLEQQVASSGAEKQPAANPEAAKTPGENASTFSLPDPSWEASQAATADMWASLAALNGGQASSTAAVSAGNQLPAPGASRFSGSMAAHDAFTDPFAAFDSGAEDVESGSLAGPAAISKEVDAFSLPMPPMDSTAVSWSAGDDAVRNELPQQAAGPAEAVTYSSPAVDNADSSQRALQADKGSRGHSEQDPGFAPQRSWGDGWADCVADGMALPSDQATQPSDRVSSWKRQEEDSALQEALGCDRQSALLCLAQAAAGILMTGQQLWAEARSLGNLGTALGCIEVQQYLAALAHVKFVVCAVDAALCCGAASAPSVEAELCRALAQSEEAWQQSPSGAASLAEALQELAGGDGSLAASAKRAHEASQCLSQPQSAGKLDPAGARCALTGLPHTACPDIPLVELHGRPAWAPVANLYLQHGLLQGSRQLRC